MKAPSTSQHLGSSNVTMPSQRGAVLLIALVLLAGVMVLGISSVSTSVMELRMAGNAESNANDFQTALAAVDQTLSDTANLPTIGPLNKPKAVSVSGAAFTVHGQDSITAEALRVEDCGLPPRMGSATSLVAYSTFKFEVSAAVDKESSRGGNSGVVQGYTLFGPKC